MSHRGLAAVRAAISLPRGMSGWQPFTRSRYLNEWVREGACLTAAEERFDGFVREASPSLLRAAWLLVGDWPGQAARRPGSSGAVRRGAQAMTDIGDPLPRVLHDAVPEPPYELAPAAIRASGTHRERRKRLLAPALAAVAVAAVAVGVPLAVHS